MKIKNKYRIENVGNAQFDFVGVHRSDKKGMNWNNSQKEGESAYLGKDGKSLANSTEGIKLDFQGEKSLSYYFLRSRT